MKNSRASRQCRGQPIDDRRLIRFRNCSVLPVLDPQQTKRIIPAEMQRCTLTFDKGPLRILASLSWQLHYKGYIHEIEWEEMDYVNQNKFLKFLI